MIKFWVVACCVLALAGCVAAAPSSRPAAVSCLAAEQNYVASSPQVQRAVLVLASDAHPQTVRRTLPLVDRIGRTLMQELMRRDIRLFDAHGLRVPLSRTPRATVTRLLEHANTDVREPVDRLVIYSVFADTFPAANGFRANLRVAAQLYDVPGGNLLVGNFEAVDEIALNLPAVCDSACFTSLLGDAALPLGRAVGKALNTDMQTLSNSYPLELFGFSDVERARIEEGIRTFPGYRSHRVEEDGAQYVRMRYASTLAATDIAQNLRYLTGCLAVPSQVEFAGARYSVRRSDSSMVRADD